MTVYDVIPAEQKELVAEALQTTFGTSELDDLRPITKGNTTALVLRIVVSGNPLLLKIMPKRVMSPERRYTCMRLSADAGLVASQ